MIQLQRSTGIATFSTYTWTIFRIQYVLFSIVINKLVKKLLFQCFWLFLGLLSKHWELRIVQDARMCLSTLEKLKSEYHASDPLHAWRPQKMADSRVYMSDL